MLRKLRRKILGGYIEQCFPKYVPQNPSLMRCLVTGVPWPDKFATPYINSLSLEDSRAHLDIKAFRGPEVKKPLMVDPISNL